MPLISASDAILLLKRGEIVALPTETVYGLGGCIHSPAALHKIFTVKKRPFFDPLIVHVPSTMEAQALALEWPEIFSVLAEHFWPGPLTFIVKKRPSVSALITSGLETVAVRCPRHPLTLEILRQVGVPVAAPSANRFGHTSPTCAQDVLCEFSDSVAVVDGGPSEVGVESTVLSVTHEPLSGVWQIHILRPGGVSRQSLRQVLEAKKIAFTLNRAHSASSPGHLSAHYQPASPLVLLTDRVWSESVQALVEQKLQRQLKCI